MLKYKNGVIKRNNEDAVLKITIADEGQPLLQNLPLILDMYHKYLTHIEIIGGENDPYELRNIFQAIHEKKIQTIWMTSLNDESEINRQLSEEIDFLYMNKKKYKREYSPFGDANVWIEM